MAPTTLCHGERHKSPLVRVHELEGNTWVPSGNPCRLSDCLPDASDDDKATLAAGRSILIGGGAAALFLLTPVENPETSSDND